MHAVLVVALVLLFGCATAPSAYQFDRSLSLTDAFDHVWEATIETMAELNLPINNMEKASGLVTTDWILVPREYLDCGSSGLATDQDHQGRFNIFVREGEAGQVQLTVNSSFQALRVFGGSRSRVECVSTGRLEQQMQSLVQEKL